MQQTPHAVDSTTGANALNLGAENGMPFFILFLAYNPRNSLIESELSVVTCSLPRGTIRVGNIIFRL